jgi:hypothetical protein
MYERGFAEQRSRLYEYLLGLKREGVQIADIARTMDSSRVLVYRYLERADLVARGEMDRMEEARTALAQGRL